MADRYRVLVADDVGFIGRRVQLAEGREVTVADLRAFPEPETWPVTGDLLESGMAAARPELRPDGTTR